MRRLLLAAAALLFWWCWFVGGFLTEPSAVGNLRVALVLVIAGSFGLGVASALAGAWMLFARRT